MEGTVHKKNIPPPQLRLLAHCVDGGVYCSFPVIVVELYWEVGEIRGGGNKNRKDEKHDVSIQQLRHRVQPPRLELRS